MTSANRRSAVAALLGAAFLGGLGLWFVFRERPAPTPTGGSDLALATDSPETSEPAQAFPAFSEAARRPATEAAPGVPASARLAPPLLDEASLMARLRELRGSNPELTLQLSREAQQRFENSPEAAEQSWFVVKSLTDLGRHDEARLEGRKLVQDYPGTRWAEDAHRHLFVNPATHPAERGFGKALEPAKD